MAASAFAENIEVEVSQQFAQPQYSYVDQRSEQWDSPDIVSAGQWVTVGDNSDPWGPAQQASPARNPFGVDINAGFGLDTKPILKWGLGAVLLMLIVSTALSVGKKVWPMISKMIPAAGAMGGARSLEEMSSLAQTAFEAFEKYQALNEKEN